MSSYKDNSVNSNERLPAVGQVVLVWHCGQKIHGYWNGETWNTIDGVSITKKLVPGERPPIVRWEPKHAG